MYLCDKLYDVCKAEFEGQEAGRALAPGCQFFFYLKASTIVKYVVVSIIYYIFTVINH